MRSSKKIDYKAKLEKLNRERAAQGQRVPKSDPDREVVILQYHQGRPSNLSKFKRWLEPICIEKFGELGTLIATGDRPVVEELPDIDPANFGDVADPLGFARAERMSAIKSRQMKIDKIEENVKPMFSFIWRHLSEESKEKVATQQDWDNVQEAYDVERLWVMIGATHQGGGFGIEALDHRAVRKSYLEIKQGRSESILDFKRRFADMADSFEIVIGAPVPDDSQAIDFIHALDDRRYAEFKTSIQNDVFRGIPLP